MTLSALQGQWHDASYLRPPSARCGHICVAVDKLDEFGTELLVIHGGINARKEAQADLAVLQVAQEQWLDLEPSAVGPAARAFHAACVIGSRVYIFAGHVFIPEQKRLHQFNDLWALDTETWQWHRMEAPPESPAPSPRDRSAMVPIDDHRLLIYGGADAGNRRLDDAWVYDIRDSAWYEVAIGGGAKPKPRCSAAVFVLGNRVLVFGGDTISTGPVNDLWSLRGVHDSTPPQWTHLQLEGPVPAPRRGHASAAVHALGGVVFVGGLSELKSMLGMKKMSEYLMDVVLLQRQTETLTWRQVEAPSLGGQAPIPREKHTLCALQDGRFFLFGGTDGTTTLGDAWWLSLEDIAPPPPDLLRFSDLEKQLMANAQPRSPPSPVPPTPTPPQAVTVAPATQPLSETASLAISAPPLPLPPSKPSSSSNTVEGTLLAGTTTLAPSAAAAAATSSSVPTPPTSSSSYWNVLPASLQAVVPTIVPSIATSALTTLRGRLGYPSTPAGDAAAAAVAAGTAPVGSAIEDIDLIAQGRAALGVDTTSDNLVRAARDYFSVVDPSELKLGALPALMRDYRRLARAGWAAALSTLGPEALMQDDVLMLGRYMHWSADDVRMRDVGPILEDYKGLLAAAAEREAATEPASATRVIAAKSPTPPSEAETDSEVPLSAVSAGVVPEQFPVALPKPEEEATPQELPIVPAAVLTAAAPRSEMVPSPPALVDLGSDPEPTPAPEEQAPILTPQVEDVPLPEAQSALEELPLQNLELASETPTPPPEALESALLEGAPKLEGSDHVSQPLPLQTLLAEAEAAPARVIAGDVAHILARPSIETAPVAPLEASAEALPEEEARDPLLGLAVDPAGEAMPASEGTAAPSQAAASVLTDHGHLSR